MSQDFLASLRKPADPKKEVKSIFFIIQRTAKKIVKKSRSLKKHKKLSNFLFKNL